LKKPEDKNGKKIKLSEYLKKSKAGASDEMRTQRKLSEKLKPPVVPSLTAKPALTLEAVLAKARTLGATMRKEAMVRRKSKLLRVVLSTTCNQLYI